MKVILINNEDEWAQVQDILIDNYGATWMFGNKLEIPSSYLPLYIVMDKNKLSYSQKTSNPSDIFNKLKIDAEIFIKKEKRRMKIKNLSNEK